VRFLRGLIVDRRECPADAAHPSGWVAALIHVTVRLAYHALWASLDDMRAGEVSAVEDMLAEMRQFLAQQQAS